MHTIDCNTGLFDSGTALVFILQRFYAWGTICAMCGNVSACGVRGFDGAREDSSGKPKPSAYVVGVRGSWACLLVTWLTG